MRYRDLWEVRRRLPKAGMLVHNWVDAQCSRHPSPKMGGIPGYRNVMQCVTFVMGWGPPSIVRVASAETDKKS